MFIKELCGSELLWYELQEKLSNPFPHCVQDWQPDKNPKAPTLSRQASGRGSIKKPALTKAALLREARAPSRFRNARRKLPRNVYVVIKCYSEAWARICKRLRSPGINSQPGGPVRQPYLTYLPSRLYIGWRNRFLGSLNSLNVYKHSPSRNHRFSQLILKKLGLSRYYIVTACV